MSKTTTLADALAAEIASAQPFVSLSEAKVMIDGSLGQGPGLRGKYLSRLSAIVAEEGIGDAGYFAIGKQIADLCDGAIAALKPNLDGSPR
jgi:hypothetical protein